VTVEKNNVQTIHHRTLPEGRGFVVTVVDCAAVGGRGWMGLIASRSYDYAACEAKRDV
jgi:hypothetical protein